MKSLDERGPVARSSRIWSIFAIALALVLATDAVGDGATVPSQQVLYGMSAVSPTDGWAVGASGRETLALRWSGSSWRRVPTPSPQSDLAFLTAASMISARDAWAVGPRMILRWDGTSWSEVPSAAGSNYLLGVSALTLDDAWAVGHTADFRTSKAVILHWNGVSWTPMTVPAPGPRRTLTSLSAVSALSARDVWAVGNYGPSVAGSQPFAVHWNGSSWKAVRVPSPGRGMALLSVSAESRGDVWAVGEVLRDNRFRAIIVHWNGRSWKLVKTPSLGTVDSLFSAVSASSSHDAWAAGSFRGNKTLTMHWDGHSWTQVQTPSPGESGTGALLSGVSVRSPGGAWAVGDYGTRSGGAKILILRWNGHSWKVR